MGAAGGPSALIQRWADTIVGQMKLGLGTVQFGLPYGIANTSGQVQPAEVRAILRAAHARGIRVLDTAVGYGNSEAALGAVLGSEPSLDFRVVSKIPKATLARDIPDVVRSSLERLTIARAHGYMFHDVDTYRNDPETLAALWKCREAGLLEKVGFSVYEPSTIEGLLRDRVHFDLVQLPYNVFDRRFEPLLPRLKEYGVEVHSRSAFLQGLFFLNPAHLPRFFAPVQGALTALRALAARVALPLPALPLGFALGQPDIDVVVVGVDGLENLQEDLDMAQALDAIVLLLPELKLLQQHDENILLPPRWKTT